MVISPSRNDHCPYIPINDPTQESAHISDGQNFADRIGSLHSYTHQGIYSIFEVKMTFLVLPRNERRHKQAGTHHESQPNGETPCLERPFQVRSSLPQPKGAETDEKGRQLARISDGVEYEGIYFLLRWNHDDEYRRDVIDDQPSERSVERSRGRKVLGERQETLTGNFLIDSSLQTESEPFCSLMVALETCM